MKAKHYRRLNLLFFLLCLLLFALKTQAQTQKGLDIFGEEADDEFGYSVSMPDANTVAVGVPESNKVFDKYGYVRIYRWKDNAWVQKGKDIKGDGYKDISGISVSMPDSNTVAIGAPGNGINGVGAGQVRIFHWKDSVWVQKGKDIIGESKHDRSGNSVSMPDANTVAIGAPYNDGNGDESGHVRIYRWNGSAWVQKGADIDGENSRDAFGSSVSMPDANTLAIGDQYRYRDGYVRIYGWNGVAWKQKGTDIKGKPKVRGFGWSVSMPDSNTLAIGAPIDLLPNGNRVSGHVSIYRWNGFSWVQKGKDIQGESKSDLSGTSVSMPDSNTVAIGATNNDENGVSSGHVRIYRWNDSAWVQKGIDMDGSAAGEFFGFSVSMPDANTVAIGTPSAILYASKRIGLVRIYSICDQNPDTTIDVHTACDSFNWLDGRTYTSTTNSPTHTLVNARGCDSVISLDLTILQSSSRTDRITACDSFTWIDNQTYRASTNSPALTLSNAAGCDSVVTLDLTINNSTAETDLVTACNAFTWIDNQTYRASTNSPTFTLSNSMACDSVVSLDLTIVNLDTSITKNEASLVSNQAGASYRWLNCDSSFTAVNGAVNQEFIPSKSGFYACEISLDGCVDTTACVQFSVRSENEASSYKLYPNPFAGELTIEACGDTQENTSIKVMNIHGQVILARTASMGKTVLYTKDWAKGVYLVQLTNREGIVNTYKLVHQ